MLTAAIWGPGKWGQALVASVQGKSEFIRFKSAVTRSPQKHRHFADTHQLLISDDHNSALHDPQIEAIVIATANSLHPQHARQAALAGKHVFVEKPFGLNAADAHRARIACDQAGVTLAVGFNRRFRPAVKHLIAIATSGEIGSILHVEGQFSGPTGLRMATESWRGSEEESPAGGMTARGIHILDLMIALCGPVNRVFTISERRSVSVKMQDTTFMLLRFNSGVTGYLGTLMATGEYWRIQIFGTNGWAEMRGEHCLVVSDLDGRETIHHYDKINTERAELEAFALATAGGCPFPVPLDDVIHGVAVFEAIVRSAKTNNWENIISSIANGDKNIVRGSTQPGFPKP